VIMKISGIRASSREGGRIVTVSSFIASHMPLFW
jgi:hypothetical protein